MIEDGHKHNFGMLVKAVKNGDVCLVECKDVKTGVPVITICVVHEVDDEFQLAPIAKLFDGDPYEELIPPTAVELE